MKLLPSNATLKEQKFALFLDEKAKEDYKEIDINPLTCKKELLPFLAVGLNVDINGLEEGEAREYLFNSLSNRTKKGTVKAVEDSIKAYLENQKIYEWWEDTSLKRGEFFIKATPKIPLTKQKAKTVLKIIKDTKNVRSRLLGVKIEHEFNEKVNTSTALAMQVKMKKDLKVNWSGKPKTNITTGSAYEIKMQKDLKVKWDYEETLFSNSALAVETKFENTLEVDFDFVKNTNMIGVVVWQV